MVRFVTTQKQINRKGVSIVCFSYNILMLFYTFFPTSVIITISLLTMVSLFFYLSKKVSMLNSLLYLTIFSVPTSFISILATPYSDFPVTWFTVCTVCLFINVIIFKKTSIIYLIIFILFSFFSLLSLLWINNIFDACKQILTISLFFLSFFIGEGLKDNPEFYVQTDMIYLYLISTISFATEIIVQNLFINHTGLSVGQHAFVGIARHAMAATMNDYSFATLFIASGSIMLMLLIFERKKTPFIPAILVEIYLLIAILLVTSRTGLYAMILIAGIYLIPKLFSGNVKVFSIFFTAMLTLPHIFNRLMTVRNGQALLDSSGRLENYFQALVIFFQHPLGGVGFGLSNLQESTGLFVPHNLIVQYLVQCGLIGTTLIILPVLILLKQHVNKHNPIRWMLYTVLVGSMFIPDIVSSRFLSVIIIMTMMNSKNHIQGRMDELMPHK